MTQKTDTRTKLLAAPPITDLIILVLSAVMLTGEFYNISRLTAQEI